MNVFKCSIVKISSASPDSLTRGLAPVPVFFSKARSRYALAMTMFKYLARMSIIKKACHNDG